MMTMIGRTFGLALIALTINASSARAKTFIYPQKDQSPEQQNKDEGSCQVWAKAQSGFDPMDPTGGAAAPIPPPPPTADGSLLRGGARGAALGAVGGAIAGNAGRGAAAGAAMGAMVGGMRRRDARRQADAQYQQARQRQQATVNAGRANFNRAFAACMEGRGYTVK